ncbi:hypothetical protein [Streptomyces sp. NPDC002156]
MPEFFQAMGAVSAGDPNADAKIHSAIQGISAERALLAAAPRLRPWVLIVEYVEMCVSQFIRMARCYLQALGATTPLTAQNKSDEAQSHLDAATLTMEELGRYVSLLGSLMISERTEDKLTILVQQAQQDFDVSDITALFSAADQSLASVIQATGVPGGGLGLQFALQDVAARFYGDQQRFRNVVKESYKLLSQHPSLLSALATSQDFLPDLQESLLELHDASAQVMHAVNGQSIPRQVGRAFVDVAASLVEGPGQLLAIALLAGTGRKSRPYDKLRQDNATELLRAVRKHLDLEPLVQGFNLGVRTAQAHRMVRYEDDGITIDTKGGSGKLSWHELADEILMAYESAMGCMVGLQVALAESGISAHSADAYRAFGISAASMATIGLISEGCENVSISEQPGSWVVELTPPPTAKLIQLAAGIAALLPDEILTLTFTAKQDSAFHVISGPAAPLRAFSLGDIDGDSYGIATIRVLHSWEYDGKPCLTPAVMRRWAAYQIHLTQLDGATNPIPRMRTLRSLALEVGDEELAETITATMRSLRLGDDTDPDTAILAGKISAWGNKTVGFTFP